MRARQGRRAEAVRRILVRCPNHAGDVVMATPGLAALREAHPQAEIVAHLPAPLIPLLEGAGLVDALWAVESRGGGVRGLRREAARIAAHGFELGVVIPESISSALLMRLGRVGHVVGFARDPLRAALLHERVPGEAGWGRRRLVSRERFVLQLVAAVGARSEGGPPRLRLATTAAEAERLEAALRPLGSSLAALRDDPPIVLAPGAGFGEAKQWPAESFAGLADRLASGGAPIFVVGAPGEEALVAAVVRAMRARPFVLAGTLDLGALKVLLRAARLLVSNDAGARHVAAAFGVPSVVFFGPTSVEKTPDNLDRVEILETDHACRPCYRRRCPIDHRCLRSLSVEQAEQAAARAIARALPAPSAPYERAGEIASSASRERIGDTGR
ncbi:MAG: lipopolysaccharide heptosyltransferase II [Myxococcota bacterium]